MPCITTVVQKYKTMAISLCLVAMALFAITNRYIIWYLIDLYSWRGACLILAGMMLQCSFSGLVMTAVVNPSPTELSLPLQHAVEDDVQDDNNVKRISISSSINNGEINVRNATVVSSSNSRAQESQTDEECKDDHDVQDSSSSHSRFSTLVDHIGTQQQSKSQPLIVENNDYFSNDEGDKESKRKKIRRKFRIRCVSPQWRFFLDIMFILLAIHVGICIASLYSFSLILMDFAETLSYDKATGVLFMTVTSASSLAGRLLVGVTDFLPKIHSFMIQVLMSLPGCTALFVLSVVNTENRDVIIACLVMVGISIGGLVVIYPKCALDVKWVTTESYPVALGFFFMMEGVFSILAAVIIGASVDGTGSYTFILIFLGCASVLSTLLLAIGYFYTSRAHQTTLPEERVPNDEERNDMMMCID